ncbi:MAG: response regulator [Lentimicrobiaceae bacterium]|jgi:CheY-like chemotaxis protein|nr:response regulator [Lentimicrobiaceae bacterium]
MDDSKKNIHILLFEDNELNQKFAIAVINRLGHTVDLAENGLIGVEKYKKGSYDLILMDIQMPEMNGIEAAKAIREIENKEGKHTPIIAVTAFALDQDRRNCYEVGMDDFLTKPYKLNDLAEKIKRFYP